jgi:hypothetical protein
MVDLGARAHRLCTLHPPARPCQDKVPPDAKWARFPSHPIAVTAIIPLEKSFPRILITDPSIQRRNFARVPVGFPFTNSTM